MSVPLARLLLELEARGTVASSALSARARREMVALFDAKVLVEARSGGGRAVLLQDRGGFDLFCASRFPSGLAAAAGGATDRVDAVRLYRDSKAVADAGRAIVPLRSHRHGACLVRGAERLDVAGMTGVAGVCAILLDPERPWSFAGTVAVVENKRAFLSTCAGGLPLPEADLYVHSSGRVDSDVIAWLACPGMAGTRVLHVGDYDAAGLDDFARLRRACGERATLHVPDDLERLWHLYAAKGLGDTMPGVRARLAGLDPQVDGILTLIATSGRALEQEALLIGRRDQTGGSSSVAGDRTV